MKSFLLFVFIICTGKGFSQVILSPVYEIKSDTAVPKIPDNYWQMQADTSDHLTFSDVRSPLKSKLFHQNTTKQSGIGFRKIKSYWQRLRLKNTTANEIKLVFSNVPLADRYDIYVCRQNGITEHSVSGSYVPFSQRDGYKNTFAVPVVLSPLEEIIIYKKIYINNSGTAEELLIGYSFSEPFMKKAYIDIPWYIGDVRNWLIAGIMFFGFFLNFFFYWIDKDKVYLYMSLLLLVEGLWYLTTNSSITFRETPLLKNYFATFITHCLFFFLVTQFVRHFLKTKKYYPKWDKILSVLLILMLSTHIAQRLFFADIFTKSSLPVAKLFVTICFIGLMICLLLSFIFFKKEKDSFTNMASVAAIPTFFLWSIGYGGSQLFTFFSSKYQIKPTPLQWYFDHEMQVEMFFIGWFAILFTWVLLQRYALLRKQYAQQELNREREKTEIINQQKEVLEKEVEDRTAKLKQSFAELQDTQAQLIQSEKMASLGELTAGIAHEIQNPLNFVNNFSEVNKELISELVEEVGKGNTEEVIALANDIKENEEKINHHGKRADAIVKGMLQHSRSSSGVKEPTDINKLADEYLRLAYHGLRAKDKSFNATLKTDYDEMIGKINIIPQDIGRVILNLITNAFYAVNEKTLSAVATLPTGQAGPTAVQYEPTVSISTKKIEGKVEIKVTDNGNGIPQNIVDKIFQPFFTTKPTGQGTGLGLSLAYDIVKANGGELSVVTDLNTGSEFKISLPG